MITNNLTRKDLVENLLVMFYEHACCSDPEMYHLLYAEAKVNGWELPDEDWK